MNGGYEAQRLFENIPERRVRKVVTDYFALHTAKQWLGGMREVMRDFRQLIDGTAALVRQS